MRDKVKILFVCHGNICRSVGAQYILQDMVNRRGLAGDFLIESAAATTEEIGNPIYPPMARQLRKADYNRYDLLIGMDEENLSDMNRILGGDPEGKLHYLMEYTGRPEHKIEDPWYTRQFDTCADEIIEGCEGLLAHFESKRR